jgi:hypothetical protein
MSPTEFDPAHDLVHTARIAIGGCGLQELTRTRSRSRCTVSGRKLEA